MFKYKILLVVGIFLFAAQSFPADEHKEHQAEQREEQRENHHEEGRHVVIAAHIANKVGLVNAIAAPQIIRQNIIAYGSLNNGPEQLSHIRARYPGLIKSVNVSIGDVVTAGELMAVIESNQSLSEYEIRSPITGTVVQRHANTGEATQNQILFSVAEFNSLWAELRVYPSQRNKIKIGQKVHFHMQEKNLTGKIQHVIPKLDHPYQLARIKINNEDLSLTPGLLIEGNIAIDEQEVPVAVAQSAVQKLDGVSGVFTKSGTSYDFQALVLGKGDHDFIEVIDGLKTGAEYVAANSYLLKAEIEKSEAEHHH